MGHLIYAGSTRYDIEDRMLAHAKAAITAKLRRQECVLLSWSFDLDHGSGRVSLWLAPSIPLEFLFSGSKPPQLNPEWFEAMVLMGTSPRGIVLMPEGEAVAMLRRAGPMPIG